MKLGPIRQNDHWGQEMFSYFVLSFITHLKKMLRTKSGQSFKKWNYICMLFPPQFSCSSCDSGHPAPLTVSVACTHADSLFEVHSHSTLLGLRRPSVWRTLCLNRGWVDRARGYGLVWDRALVCSIYVRPGFVSSKRGVESRSQHRCRGRGKSKGHVSSGDIRKARLKIVSLISV